VFSPTAELEGQSATCGVRLVVMASSPSLDPKVNVNLTVVRGEEEHTAFHPISGLDGLSCHEDGRVDVERIHLQFRKIGMTGESD